MNRNLLTLIFTVLLTYCTLAKESNIPFQLVNGLIIIEAEINQSKGKFIFDTGADELILDDKNVANGTSSFSSVNGSIATQKVKVNELKIGEFEFSSITGYKTDLHQIEAYLNLDISGIFSATILNGKYFFIDFITSEIKIFDHITISEILKYTKKLKFYSEEGMMYVDVKIGQASYKFLLDSGATTNYVSKSLVTSDFFVPTGVIKNVVSANNMTTENSEYVVQEAKIGGYKTSNLNFLENDLGDSRDSEGLQFSGIIGFSALQSDKILIDYQSQIIYF